MCRVYTGLSTPNWFGMCGQHNDDYGPSYHAKRYPPRPINTEYAPVAGKLQFWSPVFS